uniref:NADH-ubiquinone oxidoreductase chain 5 n=1 Tax=Dendropoma gregarium TaxID=169306 RepID=E2FLQ8_9CAEN|nr:NADH dehydrogenase subunit 5 [Dendropoma gregarium]ADI79374.1 NADH dehydrogenase subunit 5 [Dendropoma gregarium]
MCMHSTKSALLAAMWLFLCFSLLLPLSLWFVHYGESWLLEWSLLSLGSADIKFSLLLDPMSLMFSSVVCLISGSVLMYSSNYMSTDPFLRRFIHLVLLFVMSMNFMIYIPSLPALLLGWDGLGIVSFALVIYYQNSKSLVAGITTILFNRIGDVMVLLTISVMVLQGHWLIIFTPSASLLEYATVLVVIAGMTKSAQMPFSSWLPAAMAAPTPVSALVHSSTLVTAGVYLLVRFHPLVLNSGINQPLLLVSVLTLFMAGIAANLENDLKKVIALSTLSQLGVMLFSLSLGMVYLSMFHLLTHALFKALLFLCAGIIIHNSGGVQDLRHLGGIYYQLPFTVSCLVVANLALCGMPFLSGYYSKDLILEHAMEDFVTGFLLLLLLVATGATAAYSLRLSLSCLWSPCNNTSMSSTSESDISLLLPLVLLSLGGIGSGCFLNSLMLDFSTIYTLPLSLKVVIGMLLWVGLAVGVSLWEHVPELNKKSGWYFLFSSLWFLASLSGPATANIGMKCGSSVMFNVDQGWLETIGGQGMYGLLQYMFMTLQKWQARTFNYIVLMLILVVILFSVSEVSFF